MHEADNIIYANVQTHIQGLHATVQFSSAAELSQAEGSESHGSGMLLSIPQSSSRRGSEGIIIDCEKRVVTACHRRKERGEPPHTLIRYSPTARSV